MSLYRIMLVDDEQEVQESMIRQIDWEGAGFEMVGDAQNGEDALEKVELLQPDIVLTDIRMPYMYGSALAQRLRFSQYQYYIVGLLNALLQLVHSGEIDPASIFGRQGDCFSGLSTADTPDKLLRWLSDISVRVSANLRAGREDSTRHIVEQAKDYLAGNYQNTELSLELLDTTDKKTYAIAEAVGYTDPNYFNYVFKKKYGVSPTKYRGQRAGEADEKS